MPVVVSPQNRPRRRLYRYCEEKHRQKIRSAIQRLPKPPRACNLSVHIRSSPITFEDKSGGGEVSRQSAIF
ncbi:hypothetical protein [Mesorhizobium sp.]|uniref:hypothetical protein n=1 Tax=Mesorhizobium sp. TaxID=1871066 RepID=UPI00121512D5|nr:hypothetical protein [Mesorhizobium sp.]TIQ98202.1 MAG: hypothetical protein E5X36_11380 [Mesorhizobium sp.]